MSWDMRVNEKTSDDGLVEWSVFLVNPEGKQQEFASGSYFVGNDPDGDECAQFCLEAGNEVDRLNQLAESGSPMEGE